MTCPFFSFSLIFGSWILGKKEKMSRLEVKRGTKRVHESQIDSKVKLAPLTVDLSSSTAPVIPVFGPSPYPSPSPSPPVPISTHGQPIRGPLPPPAEIQRQQQQHQPQRQQPISSEKRLVCVTPWHIDKRASPVAYQILDSELVPLIQSIIRKVYILIGQRHTHFPLLNLEFSHLQSLMWAQSHLPTYRSAVIQKALGVMQGYHMSANGFAGKRMAINEGAATTMALHTNPCMYYAWPKTEFHLRPPMSSLSAEAQREYRFADRQLHSNMPFTLPVSLMSADAIDFYRGYNQYIHTFKEDGIRMLWIFCTVGKSQLCLWMDRKGTCYWIPNSNAPPAFYKGTIFDGELVKTQDGLAYGIFDMLWKCGRSTGEYPATIRMQQFFIALDEWNAHTGTQSLRYDKDLFTNAHRVHDNLIVRSKRFFMTRDIATLYRIMSRGVVNCDGVIHITDESPIVVGTCLEWRKSKMSHPLDFRAEFLSETSEGCWFRLCCYDTWIKRYVPWTRFGDLFVAHSDAPRLRLFQDDHNNQKQNGTSKIRLLHRQIVECKLVPTKPLSVLDNKTDDELSADDLKWSLVHIRLEKIRTNDIETVQRTPVRGTRVSKIFPRSFFRHYEKLWDPKASVPPSSRVLEAIDRQGENWDRPCPESDSVLLPPIRTFSVETMADLKRAYMIKCSSWSPENYAQSMLAHSKT